jgi:hypothetical protein
MSEYTIQSVGSGTAAADLATADLATAHAAWLHAELAALAEQLKLAQQKAEAREKEALGQPSFRQQANSLEEIMSQWCTCADWDRAIAKFGLRNYNWFATDPMILWRFTSNPGTEVIQITADQTLPQIIEVIAAHSGGADKTNPDVRTSSLCRNIGALLGTAASAGGDKKVLNIINKAEYLIGIDASSLAARGVSAHPALSRLISAVETEYVLVPTPGLPALSISDLSAIRVRNPFQNRISWTGDVDGSDAKLAVEPFDGYKKMYEAPMMPVGACALAGALPGSLTPDAVLRFAAAYSVAARTWSHGIMDKSYPGPQGMIKAPAEIMSVVSSQLS